MTALIAIAAVLLLAVLYLIWDKIQNTNTSKSQETSELTAAIRELEHLKETLISDVSLAASKETTEAVGKSLSQNQESFADKIKPLNESLDKHQKLIQSLKETTAQTHGEISTQMKTVVETDQQTRGQLEKLTLALDNTKSRGDWGERMAEDVLKAAGFVKGINYNCQAEIEDPNSPTGSRLRPDFTFMLPNGNVLHMDVKFSFDNYLRAIEAEPGSNDAKEATKKYISDVRETIRGLEKKNYVKSRGSIDDMLMFLPNESAFTFLVENEFGIVDFALEHHIVLCSPITLFPILGIVRKSVQTAQLRESSNKILDEHKKFKSQWEKFKDALLDLGEQIDKTQTKYEKVASTRVNQLEKPINRIENLEAIPTESHAPEIEAKRTETQGTGIPETEMQGAEIQGTGIQETGGSTNQADFPDGISSNGVAAGGWTEHPEEALEDTLYFEESLEEPKAS